MEAGLRALVLLCHEDDASFVALDRAVWERWLPAITRSFHYIDTDQFTPLLSRGIEVACEEAIREILTAVEEENRQGETLWILYKLGAQFDGRLGIGLLTRLSRLGG
jgi:hypothetical protein